MKHQKLINALVGADIEVFLMHRQTNEIVSAEGYVKGTKHEPFNFDPANKFYAVSLDNVAAEFCIPPASDKDAFAAYIQKAVAYINSSIPKELCAVAMPAAELHERFLQTDNAKLFGCEPDFNVWLRKVNEKPTAENSRLRSCGGHIHIGYDDAEELGMPVKEQLVKAMDLFVGVPSVLQEPDNQRKLLYGKAGCFRFKDYGVEYRTISNYYTGDARLTNWVFEATQRAIEAVRNDMDVDQYGDRIVEAINNNDKVVAQNLINELQLELA